MKAFYLFKGERSYNRAMMRIQEIGNHPARVEIERRLKAIWLLERGLMEELKVLMGVSRSTVYNWKRRLREGSGAVQALAPGSRAPMRRRRREMDVRLVEFIRQYRVRWPGMGKGIIKAELDRFCAERGLRTISESSVGRVIGDLTAGGRLPGRGLRLRVTDGQGRLISKTTVKRRKKNRRNGYQPQKPGDLVQMDSIRVFQDGVQRYLITVVDLVSRFAFAFAYVNLNSQNAADFLKKLLQVVPFIIHRLQTDNGGEFEKHFQKAIRDSPIQHYHTYPHHPQSNAFIERLNRTIRSQFLQYYEQNIEHTKLLNHHLIDYLLWYNIKKPHRGINNLSPMEYYMKLTRPSGLKSNMSWTPTPSCPAFSNMV